MKSYISYLFFTICLLSQKGFAQEAGFFQKHPVTISIFNHSVSLPFKDIFKRPLNIGISIGTEFLYTSGKHFSMHQTVQLGWFYHRELGTSVYVKSDFLNRLTASNGLFGEIQLGLGYMHSFYDKKVFELDNNGSYVQLTDKGYPGIIGGIGVGGGWRINPSSPVSISPFFRYEWMGQYPYSEFPPVFPHSMVHLGSRIEFN